MSDQMYGFTLLAVLVISGGIIAYIGDKIGMKVGRKRLTLMGLRPKHTSIVITVATGILIAGGTLGILTVASNDVRTALFHMKEIQTALATTRTNLGALEHSLLDQQARLNEAVLLRDQAERDKVAIEAERDKAQRELKAIQDQLARLSRDLAKKTDQLAKKSEELAKKSEDLEFQRARVNELISQGEKLVGRATQLQTNVKELQATEQRLRQQLIATIEQYNDALEAVRYGSFVIRQDEIVYAQVVEAGQSWDDSRDQLLAFLTETRETIWRRMEVGNGKVKVQLKGTDNQFFDDVTRLSQQKGKWVVRAFTLQNVLYTDTVVNIDIEFIENRMAFHRGQVIAKKTIDGQQATRIQDQLFGLLVQVQGEAIRAGMITQADGTVGRLVNGGEFVDAIAQIKAAGGPVEVVAVAAEDTWTTVGPMHVQLEVRGKVDAAPTTGRAGAGLEEGP